MGTVLVGGSAGLLLGARLPDRVRTSATVAVGIVTVVLGVRMALRTEHLVAWMLAVVLGGTLGSGLRLTDRIESASHRLQRAMRGRPVSEGFLTASLLFCVGPMALVGAIQDGAFGDWTLLAMKSILDGISALALAAALGPGVLLSLGTILIYQGGITLVASFAAGGLVDLTREAPAVVELEAAGGAVVLALGIGLLRLRDLRPADLLPALVLAPLLAWLLRGLA